MAESVPDSKTSTDQPTCSKSLLADGIMSMLRPVVTELDERIRATRASQSELRQHIDSLAEDLRRMQELYQAPYDLEPYVKKLEESKKRVAVVYSILQSSQDRLAKLHNAIIKETTKRKAFIEPPAPTPPS